MSVSFSLVQIVPSGYTEKEYRKTPFLYGYRLLSILFYFLAFSLIEETLTASQVLQIKLINRGSKERLTFRHLSTSRHVCQINHSTPL